MQKSGCNLIFGCFLLIASPDQHRTLAENAHTYRFFSALLWFMLPLRCIVFWLSWPALFDVFDFVLILSVEGVQKTHDSDLQTPAQARAHTHRHARTKKNTHTRTHARTHAHTHTHQLTHTHTHTQAHTHTPCGNRKALTHTHNREPCTTPHPRTQPVYTHTPQHTDTHAYITQEQRKQ